MRSDVNNIGIIGAGVGGLIAAKTFLEEGFNCEVFLRGRDLSAESGRTDIIPYICNGLYSTPFLPKFPNQDEFKGRIVHSSLFKDPELAQDS